VKNKMARKKKKKEIIEDPIIEEVIIDEPIIKEVDLGVTCHKCGTIMIQYGGGPSGYKDYKCPKCGAGLSKR